ncbi:MAG: hypothetical protein JWL76_1958 [Thermoleophilia bacterium]|nr:hypothetical protein [Thermoleophilia bacterium]
MILTTFACVPDIAHAATATPSRRDGPVTVVIKDRPRTDWTPLWAALVGVGGVIVGGYVTGRVQLRAARENFAAQRRIAEEDFERHAAATAFQYQREIAEEFPTIAKRFVEAARAVQTQIGAAYGAGGDPPDGVFRAVTFATSPIQTAQADLKRLIHRCRDAELLDHASTLRAQVSSIAFDDPVPNTAHAYMTASMDSLIAAWQTEDKVSKRAGEILRGDPLLSRQEYLRRLVQANPAVDDADE